MNIKIILKEHEKWLSGEGGSRANLSGANLSGANLYFALGNMVNIKTLALESWTVTYTSDVIQIGCQRHNIKDWFNFDDGKISAMDNNALEWWGKYKSLIKSIIELSPALPTGYENEIN
jgi:hypothetical protein